MSITMDIITVMASTAVAANVLHKLLHSTKKIK